MTRFVSKCVENKISITTMWGITKKRGIANSKIIHSGKEPRKIAQKNRGVWRNISDFMIPAPDLPSGRKEAVTVPSSHVAKQIVPKRSTENSQLGLSQSGRKDKKGSSTDGSVSQSSLRA